MFSMQKRLIFKDDTFLQEGAKIFNIKSYKIMLTLCFKCGNI